jgi:hypothetical protein
VPETVSRRKRRSALPSVQTRSQGRAAGLAHALAWQQPDAVIRADGDDGAQPQPVQPAPRAGELPALPIQAVGHHDAEAKAQRHHLFDEGEREVRLALGDIALLPGAYGA